MEESLLATCWTSAGDAASDRLDLRSPVPLRERIEAASAAGFRGFGLLSADLPAAEEEYGVNGIRAMLDDNGIVDLELEGIPYWWDDGPRRRAPAKSLGDAQECQRAGAVAGVMAVACGDVDDAGGA
jgi:sugar phosphate isomerase/epimerase